MEDNVKEQLPWTQLYSLVLLTLDYLMRAKEMKIYMILLLKVQIGISGFTKLLELIRNVKWSTWLLLTRMELRIFLTKCGMTVTWITTTQDHNCYIKLSMNKLMLLELFQLLPMIESLEELITIWVIQVIESTLNTSIESRTTQLELN